MKESRAEVVDQKKAVLVRLRRIEGQVRGVQRMVSEGKGCVEILDQVTSVKAALGMVAMLILESHAKECLLMDVDNKEALGETINDLLVVIRRMSR